MKRMLLIVAIATCALVAYRESRSEPDLVWKLELRGRYKRYRGWLDTIASNPTSTTRRLGVSVPEPQCELDTLEIEIKSDQGATLYKGDVGCRPVEVPVPPQRSVTVGFWGQQYELSLWLR